MTWNRMRWQQKSNEWELTPERLMVTTEIMKWKFAFPFIVLQCLCFSCRNRFCLPENSLPGYFCLVSVPLVAQSAMTEKTCSNRRRSKTAPDPCLLRGGAINHLVMLFSLQGGPYRRRGGKHVCSYLCWRVPACSRNHRWWGELGVGKPGDAAEIFW